MLTFQFREKKSMFYFKNRAGMADYPPRGDDS